MFLIDTSVWIHYLRGNQTIATDYFSAILNKNRPYGLTSIIYQEILQGVSSKKDFDQLSEYLGSQKFFHPKDIKATYAAAAKIYFSCRKRGITIRSTIDCLIAQIAIEHQLLLLHDDKDYLAIASIYPELQFAI